MKPNILYPTIRLLRRHGCWQRLSALEYGCTPGHPGTRSPASGPPAPGKDVLRLSVTAPPVDGKANAAVLALLAEGLGTPKSRLAIVRGHGARDKVVAVELLCLEEVRERLSRCDT